MERRVQFFEILFVVDLVSYWVHRAFHHFPWAYPFQRHEETPYR